MSLRLRTIYIMCYVESTFVLREETSISCLFLEKGNRFVGLREWFTVSVYE